ncbi:hypothetical protein [Flavobacterium sp. ALJ2]|nr:hypothetical protein [Flavobacterium sp. ALJ2]
MNKIRASNGLHKNDKILEPGGTLSKSTTLATGVNSFDYLVTLS